MKDKVLAVSVFVFCLMGCSQTSETGAGFDRKAMLTMYADEFIIPSFEALVREVLSLDTALRRLSFNPNQQNLDLAKKAWISSYSAWQSANCYNFGPGQTTFGTLDLNIGTFPASAEKIEAAIARGDTLLQNFDRDARGFLGVEYLLFGGGNQTLSQFAQPNRCAYLRAISANLVSLSSAVLQGWKTYRSDFLAALGTDGGSSASLLYNSFVASYEVAKNYKLGLPLGKRPGQTQPQPELVEAYYSGESVLMLRKHFENIVALWRGKNGTGWRAYLMSIPGGKELIESTEAQITATKMALDALPKEPLSQIIRQNDPRAESVHTEFQKLTRFFKSDMSSLLGISITYQSGDGD